MEIAPAPERSLGSIDDHHTVVIFEALDPERAECVGEVDQHAFSEALQLDPIADFGLDFDQLGMSVGTVDLLHALEVRRLEPRRGHPGPSPPSHSMKSDLHLNRNGSDERPPAASARS